MSNVRKKIKTFRKDQKEMLEIRKHSNRNEDCLQWTQHDWARIRELENRAIETFQTEMQRVKLMK